MQVYWAMRNERIEDRQRILGKFLLEDINSAAMTAVPGEAARAADDVQERKHERDVGEQNQISLRQKKIVVRLLLHRRRSR